MAPLMTVVSRLLRPMTRRVRTMMDVLDVTSLTAVARPLLSMAQFLLGRTRVPLLIMTMPARVLVPMPLMATAKGTVLFRLQPSLILGAAPLATTELLAMARALGIPATTQPLGPALSPRTQAKRPPSELIWARSFRQPQIVMFLFLMKSFRSIYVKRPARGALLQIPALRLEPRAIGCSATMIRVSVARLLQPGPMVPMQIALFLAMLAKVGPLSA